MRITFAVAVSLGMGTAGGFACPPVKKCTTSNCPGCCSADDTCQAGNASNACGTAGSLCESCPGIQMCISGKCEGTVSGGGSSGGGGAGGSSTGGGSMAGGTASDITGTYQLLWGWDGDGGRSAVVTNFANASVGAWYLDGGVFDFRRGRGLADGTFEIRDAPDGEVTVQLDRRFFVTRSRRLAFDSFQGGRRDAVRATQESTLRLTIRGLEPLNANLNRAGLFFTQATGIVGNLERTATPATPEGSTSIESDLNWASVTTALSYGLPDSTKGDQGWALQYRSTVFDGGTVTRVARTGTFGPVTLANGGTADAVATVTPPATQSFSLSFDQAALGAERGNFGRSTSAAEFSFSYRISPTPAPHTVTGQGAVVLAEGNSTEPVTLPPVELVTSFPATWGQTVSVAYTVLQPRSPADGGTATNFFGGLTVVGPPSNVSAPIGVRLGPVRSPQVEGRSALQDQSGIGLTPALSWTAPTVGTASTYRVTVSRINETGAVAEFWRIYCPEPRARVPPGLLAAGNLYVFEFEALSFGQGGLTFTLPYSYSNVVSGVLQP